MVNIVDNSSLDRLCNRIVSIDQLNSEGSVTALELEVNTDPDAKERVAFIPTKNPEAYKNKAESNTATLEIVKDDIDMSLITPNKTYHISISDDMGAEYKKYDDKYTLVYKKVIFRNFNGDFTMSTNIGLRKIGNITPIEGGGGRGDSANKKYSSTKPKSPTINNPDGTTKTAGAPKRLFYQPRLEHEIKGNNLPPIRHLKGVSLQRDFTKFSDYINKRNQ